MPAISRPLERTFFCDEDYAAYVALMAEWCGQRGVEVWACCLMPNHVHLIAVPRSQHDLRRAIDEPYLLAAARYVEWNPVRAGLVADAAERPWSSARPHLPGRDDRLRGPQKSANLGRGRQGQAG